MRCPELTTPIIVRIRYARSGTDLAYDAAPKAMDVARRFRIPSKYRLIEALASQSVFRSKCVGLGWLSVYEGRMWWLTSLIGRAFRSFVEADD
eukprot:1322639-Rhodomonas_salina.1